MTAVIGAVLIGLLALVVAGCACVVWADRGGPAWTRVVAALTVRSGEALRRYRRDRRKNSGDSGGGD
ncbi:hypothetical protein ATKI12_8962 [Kitasatospora sp. Ki12]|uniref:hypothetical protein n=1 Tax=Kitasatospora xanthocidica TaxID=83382 RepID=UPI001678E05C|nr:hypothetical protein [Kitasatospora xanthocidica]GHF92527.1 hypothetical protein GCM10018790_81900 [Kitasatospora xanthocidica]